MAWKYPSTGQKSCRNAKGEDIPCPGTGQDGEFQTGTPWPKPRFAPDGDLVQDRLTGLTWTLNANPGDLPLTWTEALNLARDMNRKRAHGRNDWRLPNKRELLSLVDYSEHRPPLPTGHPFKNISQNWYWTSTSAARNTAYAWYVHMAGARIFYGKKDSRYLAWPVCGQGNGLIPKTGQTSCFDDSGKPVPCKDTGQDADTDTGRAWPNPRFEPAGDTVQDRLTGLTWTRNADLARGMTAWQDALALVAEMNREKSHDRANWRLPTIVEMEYLTDASQHDPALPAGHPFTDVREAYWTSTTSCFEPDWSWCLYLHKGACGVGHKPGKEFFVWAVSGPEG